MKSEDISAALQAYFPEIEIDAGAPPIPGCVQANISVFDHWLSADEADNTNVLTYAGAVAAGVLDQYLDGERRFLDLYLGLAKGGMFCNRPGSPRKIDTVSENIETMFVDSLRERRFMDVYFPSEKVRVIGRWDRTDLVFSTSENTMKIFSGVVEKAGLFLLR